MDRRTFMRGFAATTLGLPFAGPAPQAHAQAEALKLSVISRSLDVNGKAAKVFGLATPGSSGPFTLTAGSPNMIDLTNELSEPTLVHWHGITPQWQFDGVPDLPLPLLQPGETRRYELPGGTGGTHWMHAHTLQEQNLLAAPLIVRRAGEDRKDEQEVVMLLHDFSFTPAEELLAKLKSGSTGAMSHMNMGGMKMDGMNMQGMSMGNMNMATGGMAKGGMAKGGMAMGGMAMDVNDIDYDAYLANDRTLADPQVTQVEKGGKVRLRIINGATATAFMIDTGALAATVIAVDGQDVEPLKLPRMPLAMGQRVDIALDIPKQGGAFPILALREGGRERTGLILATPGAAVKKLGAQAASATPALDLAVEQRLRASQPLAAGKPGHAFVLGLMGNMQGYDWSLSSDQPLTVSQGARVEIEMRNMSMMTHPNHLHGHHFQVVAINGQRFAGALRDTVLIPMMQSVTVAFEAANPGKGWPLHCHHLYHMASGMMTTLAYQGA